jgi:phi13 family phage major tail protein
VYVGLNNNAGYEGDLELALIPEEFLKDILHEEEDANGVLLENADSTFERFALLFEFTGDQNAIRHVFYCCSASRPSAEGDTKEDEKDVQTEELSIIASALANGYVKAKTGENTSKAVYDAWYDEVYMPPASEEPEDESGENDGEDQPAG